MTWIQIKLETTAEHAEFFEDQLLAAGSCAVTLQDSKDEPVYEPDLGTTPLWNSTTITGLFDAKMDMGAVVHQLTMAAPDQSIPRHTIEIVEDKDWSREWMTHFHPMSFGKRLWVCPSWKPVPDESAVNLMLDPGLAFGTGTHPTTSLCLQWLDQHDDLTQKTVIDYGCGSGILAIAALLLGAQHTVGVDIDPQALTATAENARRNHLDPKCLPVFLPNDEPAEPADIVLANILAGPLAELAPKLAQLTRPKGHIVLSGILVEQAEEISQVYAQWFDMAPMATKDGWAMLTGQKHVG